MTQWCEIKLSAVGNADEIGKFVKAANSKDLFWKDGVGPAHCGKIDVPLSFHALVPIRESIQALRYDPHGINEEMNVWGCQWGAFETELEMIEDKHALYTFQTKSRPPIKLLGTCSGNFNVKFYLSYHTHINPPRRGRCIIYQRQIYTLNDLEIPKSKDREESPVNFSERTNLWGKAYYDTHLQWVNEKI